MPGFAVLFGNCGKCRNWTFLFLLSMLISHDVFGNVQETWIAGCTVQLEQWKQWNQWINLAGMAKVVEWQFGARSRRFSFWSFSLVAILYFIYFFILTIYFLAFFFACFMVCSESFTEFGDPVWTGEGCPQPAKSRARKIQKGKWTLRCHLLYNPFLKTE